MNSKNCCFYSSGSALSCNEARQFCAAKNSTLPIIIDEHADGAFQRFIVNYAYTVTQNRPVWLDVHARPVNNSDNWHWINGHPSDI